MEEEDEMPFIQSKPQPKQEQKKRKRDSEEKSEMEEEQIKNEPESKKQKEVVKPPIKIEAPIKKETPNKKEIENSEKPLKKRLSIKDENEEKKDDEKKVSKKMDTKKTPPKKTPKKEEEEEEEENGSGSESEEMSDEEEDSNKTPSPKKKPTKKTPAKKLPVRKTPKKKEEESGSGSESEGESESDSESFDEDGSEYEDDEKKKPKKAAKKSTSKTPAKKDAPKKTPTKKTPTKKKKEEESESGSESGDEESGEDESPKKKSAPKKTPKKSTPKKSTPKKKGKKGEDEKEEESTPKKGKGKKKEEEPIREWWNEKPLPEGQKWRTLTHNGVLFADPYEPHGIKLLYDGKPVDLKPEEEEYATYYARYITTDHVKKPKFNQNFFNDFKEICNPKKKKNHWLKDFSKCDFTLIHKHLEEQKILKKAKTKEEKLLEKKKREEMDLIYGFAMVDGFKEKISNYRIEPPGLFLGRGKHPMTGKIKKRVMPEQVTINIGKKEKPPKCPIEGHKWGTIKHDNKVTWLAHWKENVQGSCKYVWLAPSSKIKGQSDMEKFEKARKLKKKIKKIRADYTDDLKDKDTAIRQRAVALYFIDHLALRVGNEKDKSKSADTVGCCSLRVEHVKAVDNLKIEFDFLGKDSMHYHNVVKVDKVIYNNVKKFLEKKKPEDKLFDQLNVNILNKYLKSAMPGLTAKVFRTYNASVTLQKELEKTPNDEDTTPEEKILYYNRANRQVAILCNHKKSVPKKFGEQIEKIDYKIDVITEEIDLISEALAKKKNKKFKRDEEQNEAFEIRRDRIVEFEEKEEQRTIERQKDKEIKKEFKKSDPEKELPDEVEKLKSRLLKLEESLKKQEINKQQREENSEVALGTSKINYNDPRISVAWTKKHNIPLEKVFSANLRKKFPWAQMADAEFKF